ncbi:hypothetical protein [Aquidulcibacter sp.]|uniref:hypothetical protein n=1 Tax=Aquidulcibacter sp. TaxID=2052990 RepID=UPI0025C0CF66|nr:hypothetical protein [Aquidulcibacter sp.]MCA3696123.1 hypothetical protein [Aquidulcibacter sp.]
MRANLILVSLLTGWSFQAFAQPNAQQTAPQPKWAQVQTVQVEDPAALARLEDSLTCAAAIQVTAMAAPSWSREPGVIDSSNRWLAEVYAAADAYGISSDKVPELVQSEMERQLQEAVEKPDALSRRAFNCAASPPSPSL